MQPSPAFPMVALEAGIGLLMVIGSFAGAGMGIIGLPVFCTVYEP